MLSAYINSRSDANKAILTLSTAAIGFLFAYSSSFLKSESFIFFLFVLTTISFAVAAISSLFVFNANINAIESYIRSEKEKERDYKLKSCNKINYWSFAAGIFLAALIVILKIFVNNQ